MYILDDDYLVQGRTKEGLLAEIKEMEEKTSYVLVEPEKIVLASYKEVEKGKEEDKEIFYTISKETMKAGIDDATGQFMPFFKKSTVSKKYVNKKLLEQSIKKTGTIIVAPVDGKPVAMYMSPGGLSSLAEKGGVGGSRTNDLSIFRDVYIMEGILKKKGPLKFCIRTVEEEGRTDRKVFGVLSEKYKPISLQLIPETIDTFEVDGSMGTAELRYWRNTQTYTEALIEFPDAAEEMAETYGLKEAMIPGIRISTSDTGDSAVRIQSTYRRAKGSTYVVQKELKKTHMGKIEKNDILKDVKKEIYAEISALPERLASLMANTIGTPDVSTEEGRKKNKALVEKVFRRAARALHIGKALGQKRGKDLIDQMCCEIDGSVIYTEFDVAMAFIGIGDRLAIIPDNARKELEKACAGAPYVDFQDNAPEIVVLPEEV